MVECQHGGVNGGKAPAAGRTLAIKSGNLSRAHSTRVWIVSISDRKLLSSFILPRGEKQR